MICSECGNTYSTSSNLKRHQKTYCKGPKVNKTKHQCEYCNKYYSTRSNLNFHISNKCVNNSATKLIIVNKQEKSKKKLEFRNKKSKVIQTTIISDNILEKLTDEMQDDQKAIDFLLTNFLNKNYGKIIERTYLHEKKSDEYPMACSGGNHFRYMDGNGQFVDDLDGGFLVNLIVSCIQNAVLKASNKLIKKYMSTGDTSKLYELYDIGKMQAGVCTLTQKITKNKIKKFLSKRVMNPNHQFFGKGKVNLIELQRKYVINYTN